MSTQSNNSIINCHTHIFTGDHVPPHLAKTFVPWPIYYLFPVSGIVKLFRWWFNGPYTLQFKPWVKRTKEGYHDIIIVTKRYQILAILSFILGVWLLLHSIFFVNDWLSSFGNPGKQVQEQSSTIRTWMDEKGLLWSPTNGFLKFLLVLFFLLFFRSGRNMFLFIMKKTWSFIGALPGPQTKELAQRYLNLGRFALYDTQKKVFERLNSQYPNGTGFIILPMDMEYMDAGKLHPASNYHEQMKELKQIKQNNGDTFFPFVFADPRRFVKEGASHFAYTHLNGQVTLDPNCFIKEYIEDAEFSGFKIYPALGYYPFDETLLPLWKYAADNEIPILTHCIRGTIFYRGTKKKEWDEHPVFKQADGNDTYIPLKLLEIDNKDFCNNFTHPLNYLCLLEEKLLRQLVSKARSQKVRDLFGFTNEETPLKYNLSHLKICFGHFGGDDEWNRFFEFDRYNYAAQIIKYPTKGISFLTNTAGAPRPGKIEQIWSYVDWYSIICSLMLQYPNVYADLSYILHSPGIQPLLKQTLANSILCERVLFGTDFYVVRNHKSEKNMLANMIDDLTTSEFDQIARVNPRKFLK